MKKTKILLTIFIIILVNLSAFSLKGSGILKSEERTVSSFHSIKFNCNGNIKITQGTPQKVIVKIDDNLLDSLKTEVNRGELTIALVGIITNITEIDIEIVMENIDNLTVNGAGNIELLNNVKTENLNLIINGAGNIKLRVDASFIFSKVFGSGIITLFGTVKNQEVEISGSGEVSAFNLITDSLKATLSGSGICRTNVNNLIDLKINMGGGTLEYKGTPKIEAKIGGSGIIKYID